MLYSHVTFNLQEVLELWAACCAIHQDLVLGISVFTCPMQQNFCPSFLGVQPIIPQVHPASVRLTSPVTDSHVLPKAGYYA